MAFLSDNIIPEIDALSKSVNGNELVLGARTSVMDGLKSFMITPKEKAQILANFEMQFSGAILDKIIDAVIQARTAEAQIAVSMAEVAIKDKELEVKTKELEVMDREITIKESLNAAQIAMIAQQTLTEEQQTAKVSYEVLHILPAQEANIISETALKTSQKAMVEQQTLTEEQQTAKVSYEVLHILPAQEANIISETALKTSQKAMVDQQKLTEVQQTAKVSYEVLHILPAQEANIISETALKTSQKAMVDQQKLTEIENTIKVTREHELLAENKNLVMAQKATEEKRRLDVMAGINIKNEQAFSTRQSAKFEEARRHTLLASTLFNNQIQKSKEENSTLNALALDADFVMTETHLNRVKAALDSITTTPITYTEELTTVVGNVNPGT